LGFRCDTLKHDSIALLVALLVVHRLKQLQQ